MGVSDAKMTMRRLGTEAQEVVKNPRLTTAQKKAELNRIETAMTKASSDVALYEKAMKMSAGSDVVDLETLQKGLARPMNTAAATGPVKGISQLNPIQFSEDHLKGLHDALEHRSRYRIATRNVGMDGSIVAKDATLSAPSGAGVGGLLPAQYVGLVPMGHEPKRVLDLVPTTATETASVEYLTHASTTGTATIVAPGAAKPNVTMNVTRNTLTMSKIAALATMLDEDMLDFTAFTGYVSNELTRLVIDAENSQVLNGDGKDGNMLGLIAQAGLTRAATSGESNIDTIEQSIADLRSGPAYCDPTGIVMNPATWSSTRREKDTVGRYLLSDNATSATANSLWGIPVVTTTTMPVGEALMFDGNQAATAYLRQGITVEIDFGQYGFEYNTHTLRSEERLAVAVNRPAAMIAVSGLA